LKLINFTTDELINGMLKLIMKKILDILIIIFFIIISLQFAISNIKSLRTISQDFAVFYLSGKQAINKQNPYLLIGSDIVRNPPPTILLFSLLTLLSVKISQTTWFVLSLFSFIIASYYIFRILEKSDGNKFIFSRSWKVWLIYFSFTLIFFPFRYNLGSGQVNNFLFLFLVLVFYFLQSKKELWAGFFLSLAILLKITPTFLLIILFLQKKTKTVVWTIIYTIIILATAFLLLGGKIYLNYLTITKSFFDFNIYTYYNQSLSGFLSRVFNNVELTKWLAYTTIIIVLTIVLFLFKKTERNSFQSNIIFWNISIICILILVPFAWQYHFVIIIFPLVTTTYICYKMKVPNKIFFFLILSYLLIGWNIKNPTTLLNKGIFGSVILSHVFFGSIILLLLNYYFAKNYLLRK